MNTKKLYLISVLFLGLPCQIVPAQQISAGPEVTSSVFFFKSKPVREMRIVLPGEHEKGSRIASNRFSKSNKSRPDMFKPVDKPILQKEQGYLTGRGPMLNIEGIGSINGIYPADPNGDIGLNHYVQTVNNSFAIWDKSGNLLYGPVDNKMIWASFPGPWNTYYWADPIFKYDQLADRWIISSMSNPGNWQPPFYTMVAVSVTGDPLGEYYCYAFQFNEINDYPKLSVWQDGYYISYNFWDHITDLYLYTLYSVIDRDAMLNGNPDVNMIQFQVCDPGEGMFFPLPADLRGTMIPVNTPCYFVRLGEPEPGNPWHLSLNVLALDADWNVPANSTFSQIAQFDLGQFEPVPYPYGPGAPQMGSDINVMTLPLLMMYPLTYRMFSDHEAMVCCQTMWYGEIHYIKWYELRKDTSGWYIYQSGNYASGDAHCFMPSISLNGNGDIALGYSVSSEDMYPSIRFTGRQAEDSTGVMTFQELQLYHGLSYSNSYESTFEQNRWGDYSSMMVDPSDDSTFWYTNMYTNGTTNTGNWSTRIFSLNLSGDSALPYAFAGNDTLANNVQFFETQGEAGNYSSIVWTTSGDGTFITNYAEHVIYLRGPGDLANGQVILTIHVTGYYVNTWAADSMILYLSPVGMEEPQGTEIALHLFPNPARDLLTLQATIPADNPFIVEIIGIEGKAVFTGRYNPVNSHFELQFDISYLTPGIYLVRLQTVEGKAIKKLAVLGG
ncbi:MAG: T9SS type A sorting domain-containing protein [Desulfobacterales bacterium]|nr:T9SS type A sorting domain-containing protein [Desulfobacterales bacterium]